MWMLLIAVTCGLLSMNTAEVVKAPHVQIPENRMESSKAEEIVTSQQYVLSLSLYLSIYLPIYLLLWLQMDEKMTTKSRLSSTIAFIPVLSLALRHAAPVSRLRYHHDSFSGVCQRASSRIQH
jgi:hypothetical protein